MMSVDLFRRLSVLVSLAASLTLLAGARTALADTEKGHVGLVGSHSLTDTSGSPGTICTYRANGRLETFKVRPPNVLARNETPGVDQQKVGWRFIIQRKKSADASWVTYVKSSVVKAAAYDNLKAGFTARSVSPALPSGDTLMADYRVFVKV